MVVNCCFCCIVIGVVGFYQLRAFTRSMCIFMCFSFMGLQGFLFFFLRFQLWSFFFCDNRVYVLLTLYLVFEGETGQFCEWFLSTFKNWSFSSELYQDRVCVEVEVMFMKRVEIVYRMFCTSIQMFYFFVSFVGKIRFYMFITKRKQLCVLLYYGVCQLLRAKGTFYKFLQTLIQIALSDFIIVIEIARVFSTQ